MDAEQETYLNTVYYNPNHPASYSGLNKLYREIRREGRFNIKQKQLKEWLKSQETYGLHHQVRRRFKRPRVMVQGLGYRLMLKEDGGSLEATDVATPVNLWLQSLWNQVDVFLQQKLDKNWTNYAYKALMDVLLNYGGDAESTQLQTQLFYRDTGGSMENTKLTDVPLNQGLIFRNRLAKNSATIDMVGPIYADVFQMPRYLLNEVDVHVKLFQNKNSFRLMSSVAGKKYKVVITEVILKAAMIGIHPDILKSHARALEPALYPLLKTEVKTFAVGKGQYNVNLDDIYQGKIPNRLILGMVSADAYAGDLTKNPFNFKHYNFDFMALYSIGQSIPSKAIQPKFSSNNYIEAYQSLFTGMEIDGKDAGLGCNRLDYGKGYTLVVFDLSSEVTDAAVQTVKKQGNLQLEIRFASALPEAINVILYASFPGEIKIDQARSIQLT